MPVNINGSTGISGVDGSAGTPAIQGSDTNTGVFFGTNTIDFSTDGTSRLSIDSPGRVGIGTTAPAKTLEVNGTAAVKSANPYLYLTQSGTSGQSRIYFGDSDSEIRAYTIYDHSDDSYRLSTAGSERLRIDSSGRLLVGTSTSSTYFGAKLQVEGTTQDTSSAIFTRNSGNSGPPSLYLAKSRGGIGDFDVVANNDGLGSIYFSGADGTTMRTGAQISAYVEGTPGANDMPGRLTFSTTADGASSPTERVRITADGTLLTFGVANGIVSGHSAAAGTSAQLFMGIHSRTSTTVGGTTSFQVYTNGNVQNTNNSYGAISDIKLKENIVDANSQWDDLKAVQVRKYNFKEETGNPTHTQIGVIAQELELVSPGLVYESPDRDEDGNDLGTVTKSVNYSVLYMKAVKALQEAMERIETLETRLTALEGGTN